MKYILLALLLIVAAIGIRYGAIILKYKSEAEKLVDEKGRAAFTESLTTIVYDADGEELAQFSSAKNSYYITIDEIPYMAQKIFIAIEDRSFYEHSGVDYSAVARAVLALIQNEGEVTQGGSTITQQLARNIFLSHEVSLERKIKEVFIARKIEKEYSKEEILEEFAESNYGTFKKAVADVVVDEITKIKTRYDELISTKELDEILDDGKEKSRAIAKAKYELMKNKIGLRR